MRISKLELVNFKRFTHLTLENIPESARLVLLVGANGSGKSCVFDAFQAVVNRRMSNRNEQADYLQKQGSVDFKIEITTDKESTLITMTNRVFDSKVDLGFQRFFGRTSLRHVPQLTRKTLSFDPGVITNDADRPASFIERDTRFENDIEAVMQAILEDIFVKTDNVSSEEIRKRYIEPINDAFSRIFGFENGTKLNLLEIIPPLQGNIARVTFEKGNSRIHYNYLSAGEKEVFNILLDLLVRKDYFKNGLCFMDEIDLHLNTSLQYRFLKEIVENWMPEDCQFWTASHSLGFIDYANETPHAVVLDFDNLDFDHPHTIVPSQKNDSRIFQIAVPQEMLTRLFVGKTIYFSENTDTDFYNSLGLENTLFFNANDKNDAFHKAKNLNCHCLLDRDFLTDQEIADIRKFYKNVCFLHYYSFENLLFHPENLAEYHAAAGTRFDKKNYVEELTKVKDKAFDELNYRLRSARDGYPFFKETDSSARLKTFKENGRAVQAILKSDDFETFYKVFPAKEFGGELQQRSNLDKRKLARTAWFANQIKQALGL